MKLFQIEEPDGSPHEESGPGLAIAVEALGGALRVAVSVGGNAEILKNRDGESRLPAPTDPAELLLAARAHAEKALARPVTHAAIVAPSGLAKPIAAAGGAAGVIVTRTIEPKPDADATLVDAARLAEDDAAATAA